jgi:pimeloyl-ACP methyl ester carboxylesterase
MNLFFREVGNGEPLIILHGLFGSCDNWLTLGKLFGEQFHTYVVDQRNHGRSPHTNEWSYELMADDLKEFMQQQNIQKATLIGHSMGGKVVMTFAQKYEQYINKLIVADIAPRYYAPHHQSVIAALQAVNLPTIKSRKEAEDVMMGVLQDNDVVQFLMKNLYREGDSYAWRMNLPVIIEKIENIGAAQTFEKPVSVPTLFVRGSRSNYIRSEDEATIQQNFSDVKIVTIENAGHWVQAEQPQAFFDVVVEFCRG